MVEYFEIRRADVQMAPEDSGLGPDYFMITSDGSDKMFQAQDEIDSMGWIMAIQDEHSQSPVRSRVLTAASLIVHIEFLGCVRVYKTDRRRSKLVCIEFG